MNTSRPICGSRISQFVCKTCRNKFSTASILRQVAEAGSKEKGYPARLCIYKAGDTRTSWLAFWKGTAIFQFGATYIFIAPFLYKNEEWEPREGVRIMWAVGAIVLSALPIATLSYLTAPFVKSIYISLPPWTRTSLPTLRKFSAALPPSTRLEFTTLRTWPSERTTTAFLDELRPLSPHRLRFANIELVRGEKWRKAQRERSWWRKVAEVLAEPRSKFYVKEGRSYTVSTGVPGVWENVALAIRRQGLKEGGKGVKGMSSGVKPMAKSADGMRIEASKKIKRQTTRPI
ncbi:uncharacterized protein BDR25DRAFT_252970, partial [Lindgomyces ingoldianus]